MIIINEAIVQLKSTDIHSKLNISNLLIKDLYNYHSLIGTFKDNITNNEFAIDFKFYKNMFLGYDDNTTFNMWFYSIIIDGIEQFDLIERVPFISYLKAGCSDIYNSGININEDMNGIYLIDENTTDELNTLTDYENHTTVIIDNYLHKLDKINDKLYIKDGIKTLKKSNHVLSILTFKMFNGGKIVNITESMLTSNDYTNRFTDSFYIDFNEDITDYIPILVVGGYVHLLDGSYNFASTSSIEVKTTKLALREKFIRSINDLDLSSINNSDLLDISYSKSDEFVKNYIKHPLSFVILIKASNIQVKKTKLEYTHIFNRYDYYADSIPNQLLLSRFNQPMPYIVKKLSDRFTIEVHKQEFNTLFMNSAMLDTQAKLDPKRMSARSSTELPLYFIDITSTKLI